MDQFVLLYLQLLPMALAGTIELTVHEGANLKLDVVIEQDQNCPSDWQGLNDDCFYISEEKLTWNGAKIFCEAKGASLAQPTTESQVQALAELVKEHGESFSNFWVGAHNQDTNIFKWLNGNQVTDEWRSNQPSTTDPWHCVTIRHNAWPDYDDSGLEVLYCEIFGRFICQSSPIATIPSTQDCKFGDRTYPNGTCLKTCLEFTCIEGVWSFTGITNIDCGNCGVHGNKPTFNLLDKHHDHGDLYYFDGRGTYVITQNGLKDAQTFGLDTVFGSCSDSTVPYIISTTYYEPGIKVEVILPDRSHTKYCVHDSNDPMCEIQVFVNSTLQSIGKSVKSYEAKDGTVLIFKNNHIGDKHGIPDDADYGDNLTCINIVVSNGLRVSLCQLYWYYIFLNVRTMPTLKSRPSKLFGLCDTFTGTSRKNYTAGDGSKTTDIKIFVESWKINNGLALPNSMCLTEDDNTTCDCSYSNLRGCKLTKLAPADHACMCSYLGGWTCGGKIVSCVHPNSTHCKVPKLDVFTCLEGGGDCEGYDYGCDCCYHWGGCKVCSPPDSNTACRCRYDGGWTCSGHITYCTKLKDAYCKNPDTSRSTCAQGRGDCGGY